MVSDDSTVRGEKEKTEEVSAFSDNENNELKIQQSNDRHTHISKYLKDEKAKRLSKRQASEAQSINMAKEELSLKQRLIDRIDATDTEFREQMRKMTSTMETVGHSISKNLALMTAMINPAQLTFVTNTNQHQDVSNNNIKQEEIDNILEQAFSKQN